MVQTVQLAAEPRDRAGKGAARALRRAGRIPSVVYGGKEPPMMISVDLLELNRLLKDPGFLTRIVDVQVAGKTHHVLPRDVQTHPVTDVAEHVDFLRVSDDTTLTIEVPVHFINENASPGLKAGGVLNVVRYNVELVCRVNAIPEDITVDLAGRNAGESIHISAVTLPDGVRPAITDRDFTIATIAAPTGLTAAAEGTDEGGEG